MPKIFAYSSDKITCDYTLSINRSGSDIIITASGTIYGNGSSSNASNNLYAHVCYNVSPANTSGTTTYVNDYGTSLGGKLIVSAPLNKTSIPASGKGFLVSWTINNNSAVTYNNCALFLSSASNDASKHAGDAYMFIGKKKSTTEYDLGDNLRYYTQTLSAAAGYSNVDNPAANSIKFNNSSTTPLIVTPNASITVSWDAGPAGTNNPIKQYEVTLNGTTKTTTTTSVTFSNLNLGRGTSYKATVKSIPTVSGYGPDTGEQSTNQVKGNTLPTAPTVTLTGGTTVSGTYYIKSGNSVTFSFSSTDADGHGRTYYRNTTNSTSGATAIDDTSWTTSTGGTYYFWSYDGMEYSSSYTSKKITIGPVLTASMGNTTSTTTYSHDGTSYTTGGTNTVSLTSSGVGTKTYKWSLMYGDHNKSMTSTQSLSSTSSSCTWAYAGSNGWSKDYQIKCVVTDQLGQTSIVTSAPASPSVLYSYTIPSAPTFNNNIFNQLGGTNHDSISTEPTANVTGSVTNDFYQTVATLLTKDTSITLTFSITSNATAGWYTGASNSTYQSSGVIPLTITNTSPATTYTLTITPTSAWGGTISSKTYTITRTGLPRIDSNGTRYSASNINTANPTSIKPFKDANSYSFVFLQGNMTSNNNNYATTSSSNTSLWLTYNNKEVEVLKQGTWSTNSTTGYVTVPATKGGTTATAGLYNWKTNTLGLNLNSSNVVGLRIKFTDVFGQTYSIDKANYLTLNFVETPSISFSISNSVSATSGTVIREKDTITYTPNITFYNTDKAVTIKTYVYKATSVSTPSATASGWSLYSGTSSTNGVTYTPNRGTSANSAIIYNTPIIYTVGEITESKYLYFKIAITYGSTTTNSTVPTTYYVSQRHVSITLPFTATFSNNNFSYTSSLSDRGGGKITTSASDKAAGLGTVNYGLQFSQTNDFSTYQWLNSEGNLVTSTNPTWRTTGGSASYTGTTSKLGTGWSFYNIRAVYQTNIGSVTKTSYSSVVTIYNASPTISYRQNQIGININGIESNYRDSAVVIGSTTEKTKVKLVAANNIATINLEDGSLAGFKIDGSSIYPANFDTSSITDLTAGNLIVNGAVSLVNPLSVGSGGTGATSFTANSLIMSGSSTTAALTTRAITNNTSNTVIANNTNIPTMNTIYYGLVTVNNASQTRATAIYAPTSAGTKNQILVSSGGTAAPTWKATASGAAYATSANGALTFGTLPVAQGGTGVTNVAKNIVFAGPSSGSDAAPSFRALVAADIPDLNAGKINDGTFDVARIPNLAASKITSGTLAVAQGGTGATSLDGAGIITKSGAQTFSGIKTFGAVPVIQANARYGGLQIRPTTYTGTNTNYAPAGIFVDFGSTTTISNSQFCFRQWSPNSTANTDIAGFREDYLLPSTTAGRTANASYDIYTTKTLKIQTGTTTASSSSGRTVTFPSAFANVPKVVATFATTGENESGNWGALKIAEITKTDFKIYVGGTATATAQSVNWIAIDNS